MASTTLHEKGNSMIKKLSEMGIKSDHLYTAGCASIGLTVVSWAMSKGRPDDSKAQADRWGLFVGEWAPTLFALGTALKLEENSRTLTS